MNLIEILQQSKNIKSAFAPTPMVDPPAAPAQPAPVAPAQPAPAAAPAPATPAPVAPVSEAPPAEPAYPEGAAIPDMGKIAETMNAIFNRFEQQDKQLESLKKTIAKNNSDQKSLQSHVSRLLEAISKQDDTQTTDTP